MKRKVMGLLFFICLIFSVSATNHYVRSDAGGANNGNDWANAYTSLPNTLIRGDTYYIADGNYPGYIFDDAVDGNKYIYIKKATADEHGTNVSWLNSYGDGQAFFRAPVNRTIVEIRVSNIIFDGVKGDGTKNSEYGFVVEDLDCSQEAAFSSYRASILLTFGAYRVKNINISHVDFENCGQGENWYCTAGDNVSATCDAGEAYDYFYNDLNAIGKYIDNTSQCLPVGDGYKDSSNCRPEWYDVGMGAITQSGLPRDALFSDNINIEYNKFEGSSTHILFIHWNNSKISNNYFGHDWGWSDGSHNQQLESRNADNIEISNNIFEYTDNYVIGTHTTACTSETPSSGEGMLKIKQIINDKTIQVYNPIGSLSWATNQWKGRHVRITFNGNRYAYKIESNTQDTITITMPWIISDGIETEDSLYIISCAETSEDWNIFNNLILETPYFFDGIGSADSGYQDTIHRWNVHHNTIIVNEIGGSGFVRTGRITNPVKNHMNVYNNLFVEVMRPDVDGQNDLNSFPQNGVVVHSYNSYYSCTDEIENEEGREINNSLTKYNVFVNPDSGDYRLKVPTALGKVLTSPFDVDRDGNVRINWDRGAFEYVSDTPPIPSSDFHFADKNEDCNINESEIGIVIQNEWLVQKTISVMDVIGVIRIWSHGGSYESESCSASAQSFDVASNEKETEETKEENEIVEEKNISVPEVSGDEILWLKFDGDFVDFSGNGNIVSAVGNVSFVEGKNGQGVSFDGAGDRLAVSLPVLTSKTISFWAKFDLHKSYNMIYEDSAGDYAGFNRETALRINWLDNSGEDIGYIHDFGAEIGSWNHYVIVYDVDGDSLEIRFYRDGKLFEENAVGSVGLIGSSITSIGARNDVTGSFAGDIDEIRVWGRALSEAEIQGLV